MDTSTSYSTRCHRQASCSGQGSASIDAFGAFSPDYGLRHIDVLPAGEPSRLDGPALTALALIIAGLPVLTLILEKLA
jgi:hypothetical protein